MMQDQDDAIEIEDQIARIGVGTQLAGLDRLLDGAHQFALPRQNHADQFIPHRTRPIVVFAGA